MNLVLFTGNECNICHDAEEAFKKAFKEELESGEADIVNLDEDEESQQFWMENELPVAPCMIVVSDKKKVISILDTAELIKKDKEPEPEPVAPLDKARA